MPSIDLNTWFAVLEWLAVALGIASVGFTARRNILCWPTGLAMVLLYAAIFCRARLYSDMLLQFVFVGMQIFGWWAWLRGGPDRSPLIVGRLSLRGLKVWIAVVVGASAIWGALMARYTDADFAYLDATAAVASLVAQWLLGRKILESWLFWIFVDVLSVGLYGAKELYLTLGLYILFLCMAIWGWVEWRAAWRKQVMA